MYSNSTTHYNLPQYEANDVPSILGDLNGAYDTIDGAIYAAADEASEATATAALAKTTADTALANVAGAQADATQALADAATADGKAVAAQTDATQALGDASDAMTAATNAQTDATNALTAATNAQTTASSALSAASDATTAAGNAATAASAAQTTANSAVSAASAAQSDATQALADAATANGKADANTTLLGNTTLPTTAQTVTGAIDELYNTPSVPSGTLVFLGTDEVNSSYNGTKTHAQAMNEVYAELSTVVSNLQTGEYIKLTKAAAHGYNVLLPRDIAFMTTIPTSIGCIGFGANSSTHAAQFYLSNFSTNSSYFTAEGTTTYTNASSTIPASGRAYIQYEKYKTV